ncbi:MAG: hypothetical protein ACXWG9_02725 [Usitatibacter sp.]
MHLIVDGIRATGSRQVDLGSERGDTARHGGQHPRLPGVSRVPLAEFRERIGIVEVENVLLIDNDGALPSLRDPTPKKTGLE